MAGSLSRKKLATAIELITLLSEDVDPYTISSHCEEKVDEQGEYVEPCEGESVWLEEGILLSEEEIAARDCLACTHLWSLHQEYIERTTDLTTGKPADPSYVELAFLAFDLEGFFDTFNPQPHEVSASEYQLIRAVKSERAKREKQLALQRAEQSRPQNNQA